MFFFRNSLVLGLCICRILLLQSTGFSKMLISPTYCNQFYAKTVITYHFWVFASKTFLTQLSTYRIINIYLLSRKLSDFYTVSARALQAQSMLNSLTYSGHQQSINLVFKHFYVVRWNFFSC